MRVSRSVDFRFSSVSNHLKGRAVEGKPRLWSIEEFDSKVKHIHIKAMDGDPFAAECMRLLEKKIEILQDVLESGIKEARDLIQDSGIKTKIVSAEVKTTIVIGRAFCPLTMKVISLLKKYDNYYFHRCNAVQMGLIEFKTGIGSTVIDRRFNGLRNLPFTHYVDRGVRSHDEAGSMEWEKSARALQSEPKDTEYNPVYFANGGGYALRKYREMQAVDNEDSAEQGVMASLEAEAKRTSSAVVTNHIIGASQTAAD